MQAPDGENRSLCACICDSEAERLKTVTSDRNSSAITARISCCAAYIAAYAAKSSLMAKRHMPDKSKTPLQASLLRIFVLISRMAEWLRVIFSDYYIIRVDVVQVNER